MKKNQLSKEYQVKIGRTPTSKNNLTNISFFNKRGASTEEKGNKSMFRNFLEFKKGNPLLDKTSKETAKMDSEHSKEMYKNFLNNNNIPVTTSTSLPPNPHSAGNLNGFELIEKIFKFMKPKISPELYSDFKRFISEELTKLESGSPSSINNNHDNSFSSINDILNNVGVSRNLHILDESTVTNTINKNSLSNKLNVKLMNNLRKKNATKKMGNNSISKMPSEEKSNLKASQIEIKSSLYSDYKSVGKLNMSKELTVSNSSMTKIISNNSRTNLKVKSNDPKSLNNSAQKLIPKDKQTKQRPVNEISINLNDLAVTKADLKAKPNSSKAAEIKPLNIKESGVLKDGDKVDKAGVNNHEMVNAIKAKIDDDLKHLFNFSYDNFHSKEQDESMASNRESLNY